MIGIETFPGIFFEIDESILPLPQDGQRIISMLENLSDSAFKNWMETNIDRWIKNNIEAFIDLYLRALQSGEIPHEVATVLTLISTKKEIAHAAKMPDGTMIKFGRSYSITTPEET
jgi:hypothetical protein